MGQHQAAHHIPFYGAFHHPVVKVLRSGFFLTCEVFPVKKDCYVSTPSVSPINVIKTINVIPAINVLKINHKCNTYHKCNNF